MVNQAGSIVAKYTYDPWGKILSIKDGSGVDVSANPSHVANINPIRYAGYRYDTETGSYYLLARYYDPGSYRFLTKDPDGGDNDKPLTQNPYLYSSDNPVNNVDPEGEYNVPGPYQFSAGDVVAARLDPVAASVKAVATRQAIRRTAAMQQKYKWDDNQANAFRHAYWSAHMTRTMSKIPFQSNKRLRTEIQMFAHETNLDNAQRVMPVNFCKIA